ncbi:sensor histidine kinase [Paenibacillus sp. IHBB 10380]|uniref:sensor histidine kinase n=1 Tax=Paenibacillus sp. IHBB 10380 TaxID=1566358 RepID=UPI0005CFA1FE|nr:sensor histidine kinase [Paenibacillus sp. IHBB 10380]AJS60232.1 histidine kinase [Paenibacillus sp. IHBB 10380]
MSIFRYIKERRNFLLLYFLIMFFISTMIYLSDEISGTKMNLLYINVVSAIFILIYLIIGYLYHIRFYQELNIALQLEHDTVIAIPNPHTYEQELYTEILKKLYLEQQEQMYILHEEKKEYHDFIMSWIHEVKTPIATSQLLMRSDKPADILIGKLEDELERIDHFVEQALYYSRLDSFSKDYFIQEISLETVTGASMRKYTRTFIAKRIQFERTNLHVLVESDAKWLSFIVDQLVANSLKYTDEHGQIKFIGEEDDNEKRLIILDNGVGIKAEDMGRVFERGFTGFNGRLHTKSTGLGLYLAKRLSHKLGHDISIESKENGYTKVTLHFPKTNQYHTIAKT